MNRENYLRLLVLNMKRCIDIIETNNYDVAFYDRSTSELNAKLHEIRRDSIKVKSIHN